jgi:general secretion pathway protein D
MVFLRPYIVRDSAAGRAITLNRYDFMRRAQGALQPQRSWAMPGMQAPQLPAAAVGVPAVPASGQPRATIRAVPLQ